MMPTCCVPVYVSPLNPLVLSYLGKNALHTCRKLKKIALRQQFANWNWEQ
jgi:hypothetical protein